MKLESPRNTKFSIIEFLKAWGYFDGERQGSPHICGPSVITFPSKKHLDMAQITMLRCVING